VVRIFNSYIPVRTVFLIGGEIAMVFLSFALAFLLCLPEEHPGILYAPSHFFGVFVVVLAALTCSHYFQSHPLERPNLSSQAYPRIMLVAGILTFAIGILSRAFPAFLVSRQILVVGLPLLALSWLLWRWAYVRLIFLPAFRERVFLIGDGERARRIQETIAARPELGMDLAVWTGEDHQLKPEELGAQIKQLANDGRIHRVIVAMKDRRANMPVKDLLELRLNGITIDDGTSLLEKISGKIEVDELLPSWLIFGDGFKLARRYLYARRAVSTLLALCLSLLTLPFLPIIIFLIKVTSSGPFLYKQKRVGLRGQVFDCYKFRTMRQDAEADIGPTWASDDDPRITVIGRFLRRTRLDEVPQLWNILKGDMAFVGPRPERPEFVAKLSEQIPFYNLRHVAPPGLTGWAQTNYGYGSSIEQAKEKLRFDLYYVRNVSVMLDLLIVFYTMRTVIIGRGVR
jgi:sugar transferase (PEP-CTERM system associated)